MTGGREHGVSPELSDFIHCLYQTPWLLASGCAVNAGVHLPDLIDLPTIFRLLSEFHANLEGNAAVAECRGVRVNQTEWLQQLGEGRSEVG